MERSKSLRNMNILKIDGISRKYLRLAATYRRFAGHGFDFSRAALIECYEHESLGKPYKKDNGYVYGKWCKDITLTTWKEDLAKGDICKAEIFYIVDRRFIAKEILSRNGWWVIPALEAVGAPIKGFFPHQRDKGNF